MNIDNEATSEMLHKLATKQSHGVNVVVRIPTPSGAVQLPPNTNTKKPLTVDASSSDEDLDVDMELDNMGREIAAANEDQIDRATGVSRVASTATFGINLAEKITKKTLQKSDEEKLLERWWAKIRNEHGIPKDTKFGNELTDELNTIPKGEVSYGKAHVEEELKAMESKIKAAGLAKLQRAYDELKESQTSPKLVKWFVSLCGVSECKDVIDWSKVGEKVLPWCRKVGCQTTDMDAICSGDDAEHPQTKKNLPPKQQRHAACESLFAGIVAGIKVGLKAGTIDSRDIARHMTPWALLSMADVFREKWQSLSDWQAFLDLNGHLMDHLVWKVQVTFDFALRWRFFGLRKIFLREI